MDAENVLSLWEEADSRSPECQGKREVMLYLNQKINTWFKCWCKLHGDTCRVSMCCLFE